MKNKSLRIATCCMAGTLLVATPVCISPDTSITAYASSIKEAGLDSAAPVAGVSLAVSGYLEKNFAEQDSNAKQVVAAKENKENKEKTADTADSKKSKNKKNTKKKNSKEKEPEIDYKNMAVAQVNDYVNIRKQPNEDGKLVGKLHSNSVATVLKKKNGWYKIKSGTVTGYVKGDYITVGNEKLIKSVGTQVATVNTTTLKVRDKASKKSEVLTLVPDGEELTVASMKSYKNGWVQVSIDGGKGYVSTDYVDLSRQYAYAESREEEEARLAAERARIEEEQRRAAEASSSSSSQTGTSSSSSSDASSSSSSSSTSSSGQAVVNYASQFVGNPYVYGGTSLTNGADCSGFVMSVYAHFGISLPHSSSALRGVGRGVSYSDRQPGDIICYDGHVAIYVGNNTIVHASNPATGIKYTSPANYRQIVAVRRIF